MVAAPRGVPDPRVPPPRAGADRATEGDTEVTQAILSATYHRDADRLELVTPWCILIIDRQRIEELRQVSQTDMETITVSAVGLHIENADVDINSAGLITEISQQLETQVAGSF
jgi:hypothetical protein